jgi:hypothetical protein
MSNNRSNDGWLFLAGLAAGAAIGWLLNSDRGRVWRHDTGEKLNQFGQDVSTKAKDQWNQVSSSMNQAIERGKQYASAVGDTVKEKLHRTTSVAEDMVDDAETSFKRGADTAKKKLASKEADIENMVSRS